MNPVVSLVSDPSTEVSGRENAAWSSNCFFKVPNLSDETKRLVSEKSAWPAFIGILDAMNNQIIRGRTPEIREAAALGVVGVGLSAIARAVGVNVSTVRRQVRRLEQLGLVAVHSPVKMVVTDPDTGRIRSKSAGRTPPCTVYLTITEDRLRPFKRGLRCNVRHNGDDQGAKCNPSDGSVKAQNALPSEDSSKELSRHRRPSGRTSGAGRPEDRRKGGTAANYHDDHRPVTGWTGTDAERFAATKARIEAEAAEREASEAARKAERDREASKAASIQKAGDDLVEAILKLPQETQKEIRRRGRKTKRRLDAKAAKEKPTPAASEKASTEGEELQALIDRKRREQAASAKERFNAEYHEDRIVEKAMDRKMRELAGTS
jgi:DNA-binding transcriptional regulator YhcF (GntR family)